MVFYRRFNKPEMVHVHHVHSYRKRWPDIPKLLVEDLYSRKIIGWVFGKIMDAELAGKALKMQSLM